MVNTSQLISQHVYLYIRMHTYMHMYIMCVFKVSYVHACVYMYTYTQMILILISSILWSCCKHWVSKHWSLLLREILVRFLQASHHNILITWSIHSLVLYVFLFKDTLLNIYCQIINIEHKTINTKTHAWMLHNMFIAVDTSQSSCT